MVEVSVITPAYHSERFVEGYLDHMAAQTWQDFDIWFFVDDMTYDDTIDIVMSHELWPITHLMASNVKTSPAHCRNHGVEWSDGKRIAFCDVDDWWEPIKMSAQVHYLDIYKEYDLVYTDSVIHRLDQEEEEIYGEDPMSMDLREYCPVAFSSLMCNRHVLEDIKFDERLKACDDYKWLLDVKDRGYRIGYYPQELTHLLYHGSNLTSDNNKAIYDVMRVHRLRGEYRTAIYKYLQPQLVRMKAKFFKQGTWRLNN